MLNGKVYNLGLRGMATGWRESVARSFAAWPPSATEARGESCDRGRGRGLGGGRVYTASSDIGPRVI